jgi:hypothetical protein
MMFGDDVLFNRKAVWALTVIGWILPLFGLRMTLSAGRIWSVIRLWHGDVCVLDISPTAWGWVLMTNGKRINVPIDHEYYTKCCGVDENGVEYRGYH